MLILKSKAAWQQGLRRRSESLTPHYSGTEENSLLVVVRDLFPFGVHGVARLYMCLI